MGKVIDELTTDALEQRFVELESFVSRIRAEQIGLLREADARQVPLADGCRTVAEWVVGRIDVSPESAKELVAASRVLADQPQIEAMLADGLFSFDRTVATARLMAAGADQTALDESRGLDISGIRSLTARLRHVSRLDEQQVFSERFLTLQPSLDHSSYRLWGHLPGWDGQLVERALDQRADQFAPLPDGQHVPIRHRRADALVSIATDSLTSTAGTETSGRGPVLSVFTNANTAIASNGQAGSVTEAGVGVGISVIEEILCGGSVEHTIVSDGQPLVVGRRTRVIPPRLRSFILYRDGGCLADGCTSRYRLQVHHRVPWSEGGRTDADNLISLCWFHHHVVIHGMGYTIRPDSKPRRIRFQRPSGTDPP